MYRPLFHWKNILNGELWVWNSSVPSATLLMQRTWHLSVDQPSLCAYWKWRAHEWELIPVAEFSIFCKKPSKKTGGCYSSKDMVFIWAHMAAVVTYSCLCDELPIRLFKTETEFIYFSYINTWALVGQRHILPHGSLCVGVQEWNYKKKIKKNRQINTLVLI